METVNHECYVSLEVAKLLKEAGFDWECEHPYFNGVFDNDSYEPDNFLDTTYQIAAPTLDVAQRWLREVKGFNINTCWLPKTLYGNERFVWNAYFACDFLREGKPMHDVVSYGNNIEYCTYEEAQEAGIKKVLETILEKEEEE